MRESPTRNVACRVRARLNIDRLASAGGAYAGWSRVVEPGCSEADGDDRVTRSAARLTPIRSPVAFRPRIATGLAVRSRRPPVKLDATTAAWGDERSLRSLRLVPHTAPIRPMCSCAPLGTRGPRWRWRGVRGRLTRGRRRMHLVHRTRAVRAWPCLRNDRNGGRSRSLGPDLMHALHTGAFGADPSRSSRLWPHARVRGRDLDLAERVGRRDPSTPARPCRLCGACEICGHSACLAWTLVTRLLASSVLSAMMIA